MKNAPTVQHSNLKIHPRSKNKAINNELSGFQCFNVLHVAVKTQGHDQNEEKTQFNKDVRAVNCQLKKRSFGSLRLSAIEDRSVPRWTKTLIWNSNLWLLAKKNYLNHKRFYFFGIDKVVKISRFYVFQSKLQSGFFAVKIEV